MIDNYPKAYKEVIEILKYVPTEDVQKIPDEILKMFKRKMDKDYIYEVDPYKEFKEQNMLEETKAILANVFRDYWATEYQKERIINKQKYDLLNFESEKRDIYNPNNLFKNDRSESIVIKSTSLIEYKQEKWYIRFIKFMKKVFKIR